ncbi:DUF1641 domain-containing protein [Bacillus sp. RG28]|uniref:DUF1641 domain-containing protein n=1 Tax=Gottfriedia endophytica TaxID=2820819 RepID=A0A940NQI3_9BACI|nr:DUF1641 domain-containing protein [Gottfriedia endophytica]MBP0725708.1 DUF1641 domain-containing protein [Gottfriedia endophytica]
MSETNAEQNIPIGSNGQFELLDQLLNPEVQKSLTSLIEQLPKLTEIVTCMTKTYDFAQSVATDDVLKNDTVGAIKEIMDPVTDNVKRMAVAAIEAKDYSEDSNEVIGIFGILRMLKDPQVQRMLRCVNAYLRISARDDRL